MLGKFYVWIGDKGYDLLLFLNCWYNCFCSWWNIYYWLLVGYIKKYIKGVNKVIECYCVVGCDYVRVKGLDGIICGYIYYFELLMVNGIYYINDGDWIENCLVLVEDMNGELILIYFNEYLK